MQVDDQCNAQDRIDHHDRYQRRAEHVVGEQ